MQKIPNVIVFLLVVSLALVACGLVQQVAGQPYLITGSFDYTNTIITDYYVEHAIALVDMYGFVTRNLEWEIPVEGQTLGFLSIDMETMHGEYSLQLPAKPAGILVDVDNNGKTDGGVQVFVVAYWPNLTGGPYSEGDDPSHGWPSYLTSVVCDTENKDEVIGGKLVVWAPDAKQSFPNGYGADGLLFTADDPTVPVQSGYTIVDLDQSPFAFNRELEPQLMLYEPRDVAIKDFSTLSYTEAFDSMFEIVRKEYAFSDIPDKAPVWDALYAELKPRVEQAEASGDAAAFYLALRDFTWAFKDGHVGLDGGDVGYQIFLNDTSGGFGFAIRELDDGRYVVVYVMENGPAARAGMQVGAQLTEFNGEPVAEALAEVMPWSLPHSTQHTLRYQQARYLLRAIPGTEASVAFTNPQGESQTAALVAIPERESFSATSVYAGQPQDLLPVQFEILDSDVGYVRISSNYDDLALIIKLFERALQAFEQAGVPGIIIDMRFNSGGAPLGLAGFLYDQEIPLGQLEYYSEETGQFEPEGVPDKILPNTNQYRFGKMALLVGPACSSACEIESYGFSQVPDMMVVGMYPSNGILAEVARGQFLLPEGFSLQVPTGRYRLPDGSIFLEGVGVQPTLLVPITEENLFAGGDVVLQVAERAVLLPYGADITPSAPPRVLDKDATEQELGSGAGFVDEMVREQYSTQEMIQVPATFTYTAALNQSETLLWTWGWCAKDGATLEENLGKMQVEFVVGDRALDTSKLLKLPYDYEGQRCSAYLVGLTDWVGGEHHLKITLIFKEPVNDGVYDYLAGQQVFEYTIYVKP